MYKDFSRILLGYRDYNQDEMYGKDFTTLDAVVDWIDGLLDSTTEITKEFCDFVEQEYGIEVIIEHIKVRKPRFPYAFTNDSVEDVVNFIFDNRDKRMKASQFTDTEIPRVQSPE